MKVRRRTARSRQQHFGSHTRARAHTHTHTHTHAHTHTHTHAHTPELRVMPQTAHAIVVGVSIVFLPFWEMG